MDPSNKKKQKEEILVMCFSLCYSQPARKPKPPKGMRGIMDGGGKPLYFVSVQGARDGSNYPFAGKVLCDRFEQGRYSTVVYVGRKWIVVIVLIMYLMKEIQKRRRR